MKPVSRKPMNKHKGAKSFRHQVKHTKHANMRAPMRGGWRM